MTLHEAKDKIAQKLDYGYQNWRHMEDSHTSNNTWELIKNERLIEAYELLTAEQQAEIEKIKLYVKDPNSYAMEQINRVNDKNRELHQEIKELTEQLEDMTKQKDDFYNELYELKNKA